MVGTLLSYQREKAFNEREATCTQFFCKLMSSYRKAAVVHVEYLHSYLLPLKHKIKPFKGKTTVSQRFFLGTTKYLITDAIWAK